MTASVPGTPADVVLYLQRTNSGVVVVPFYDLHIPVLSNKPLLLYDSMKKATEATLQKVVNVSAAVLPCPHRFVSENGVERTELWAPSRYHCDYYYVSKGRKKKRAQTQSASDSLARGGPSALDEYLPRFLSHLRVPVRTAMISVSLTLQHPRFQRPRGCDHP